MIIPGLTVQDSSLIIKVLSDCEAVDQVILYGSRAIGNFKPGSDIDITLVGSNLNLEILNDLTLKFAETSIPYSLDLSIRHQINNPDLQDHISRIGLLLYNKKHHKDLT